MRHIILGDLCGESITRFMHRLDKTKFIASKIGAPKVKDGWKERPLLDRLSAAWILSCRVYDLDPHQKHRIDRTKFRARLRDD